MQLNPTQELLKNLSIISEDENLLKRAVKYLRKLASEKEVKEESAYLSEQEFYKKILHSENQIKAGNYIKIDSKKELSEWMERL